MAQSTRAAFWIRNQIFIQFPIHLNCWIWGHTHDTNTRTTQLLLGCVTVWCKYLWMGKQRGILGLGKKKICKGMYKIDRDERPELREGKNRSDWSLSSDLCHDGCACLAGHKKKNIIKKLMCFWFWGRDRTGSLPGVSPTLVCVPCPYLSFLLFLF